MQLKIGSRYTLPVKDFASASRCLASKAHASKTKRATIARRSVLVEAL